MSAKKIWGGRFEGETDPAILAFTSSFPFDRRLVRQDLVGSLAHARMLRDTGIVPSEDGAAIFAGLSGILRDVETGRLSVEGDFEDVHAWIEAKLFERIGEAAGRLHTARSRNDQTATALRLWVREEIESAVRTLVALEEAWLASAREHVGTAMPGYTHLQRGQPVSLAHHLLAHFWFLAADRKRLVAAHRAAGTSPLGAGALAGSPHPIDPRRSAELLGFEEVFENSIHAVSDRDYVVETTFACALALVHLSRWAEEVVLWTSSEFGFAELDDSVAMGSSLMPQKKNPEPAELLRAKTGRVVGDLTSLLVVLKSVPLAYGSDLQEDKPALFDALDTTRSSFDAARRIAAALVFRPDRMAAGLGRAHATATDFADYLVRKGVPFRTAHEQTGKLVREAERRGATLAELPLDAVTAVAPAASADFRLSLSPETSIAARRSRGGPAPEAVARQIEDAAAEIASARAWLDARVPPPVLSEQLP